MRQHLKTLANSVTTPKVVVEAVTDGSVSRKIKHAARKTIDDVAMTPFLRKITFFSSGGAFLEGYALSLIGVALTQITPLFNLDSFWSAAIGASVFLGILVGAILGGYLTDLIGRRKMFIIDMIAIGVVSILSMFSTEPLHLVLARFFIGFFVGADYPISTAMITEFTSKKYRAIAMGMVSASWYFGATAAAFVGFALFPLADGWKWMLGSAAIPCLILLIGRHDIPESPLWLRAKGRIEEARTVMDRVYGEDVDFNDEEQVGRRPLLIGSLAFMAVGLVILGVFPTAPVIVVILAFGLYAFFSGGPGILQWLYPNELFPTAVRASAVGIAISISRVGTIVSTYGTPLMLEQFGVGPTMLAAAALVVLGLVLSIFMAPETRGKSLAETSKVG